MVANKNNPKNHLATKVVRGHRGCDNQTGAVSFPIYQTATFRHPGLNQSTGYDYSRQENPTREELEGLMSDLECGSRGFAFSSGMAAITTLVKLFSPGDNIIVSDDLYGGTYRLFEKVYSNYGIQFNFLDTSDIEAITKAIQPNTKAVFVETPSNPTMKVVNIEELAVVCSNHKLLLIVDNTFLTPYFQQPLMLGADIVVHSGTKFLGGHNDTLAGFLVVKSEDIAEKIFFIQVSEGAVLAPFDCWLMLRGIKTLAVRLEQQQSNALQIANWLKQHPKITKVNYVGLPEHLSYKISCSQTSGHGSMISFEVSDISLIEKVLQGLQLIIYAESLGGVETLITYPLLQTHAAIPSAILDRLGINGRLLRLSVGIEAVQDVIADLQQALAD